MADLLEESRLALLGIVLAVVATVGVTIWVTKSEMASKKNGAGGARVASTADSVSSEIALARQAAHILKQEIGGKNPAVNWICRAVEQPDFPGLLGEEGCVVKFDSAGNPIWLHGNRMANYGGKFGNRTFTKEEVRELALLVMKYRQEKDLSDEFIIIMSNKFRRAACEYLLNKDPNIDYEVGREGISLMITRKRNGERVVIAADGVFDGVGRL